MASCLGLYIEKNLIKYAKVSKNNDAIKVESFGVKFYENLESTIQQIVEETYSFKIPISINLTDEVYHEIEVFSMLSKKDMDGVIKTEFESICDEKGVSPNIYEQRYFFANLDNKGEKIKAIHISAPKTSIVQKKNQLAAYKVQNISPIAVTIPNLLAKGKKETALIVNIEKNTTITKIVHNKVVAVNTLTMGAEDILDKIKEKENSYSKAYEICKNATIYTEEDKDLQYQENAYLEDIMPTLFDIVSEVRKIAEESFENIEKIYITGTASVINNIDIYFQEYLRSIPCEVLKPSFVNKNSKINIKDYIEVNSAIATGLQGLEKKSEVNFTEESALEKVVDFFKTNFSKGEGGKGSRGISDFLQKFSRQYNIVCSTMLIFLVTYLIAVFLINLQLDNKIAATNTSIENTRSKISTVQDYRNRLNQQTAAYERLVANIENMNNSNSEDKRYRNTIPNLLNNIMAVIPKQVQLSSIENTSGTHVIITARSPRFEQIAYFKTKLKTEGILNNVVSDTGTMQSGYLSVTIEGELP